MICSWRWRSDGGTPLSDGVAVDRDRRTSDQSSPELWQGVGSGAWDVVRHAVRARPPAHTCTISPLYTSSMLEVSDATRMSYAGDHRALDTWYVTISVSEPGCAACEGKKTGEGGGKSSGFPESNQGPIELQSTALPLS